MKIVQIINVSGQVNGHAKTWDSTSNEVSDLYWAWPDGFNRTRVVDRLRLDERAMGFSFTQSEADGKNYLNYAYTATAGPAPSDIVQDEPTTPFPYHQGSFSAGGNKMYSFFAWRGQYGVYDFTEDAPTLTFGAIGSFPYNSGGLTSFEYADGSTRFITILDDGLMYLSTPLDGSELNTAVTLAFDMPPSASYDGSNPETAYAFGAVQIKRLLSAGGGTPAWGGGWIMANDPEMGGIYLESVTDHSVLTTNADGTFLIQFVKSSTLATTISVSASGSITAAESVTVSGVEPTMFNNWYIEGLSAPPVIEPFWTNFVRAFEDLDAA